MAEATAAAGRLVSSTEFPPMFNSEESCLKAIRTHVQDLPSLPPRPFLVIGPTGSGEDTPAAVGPSTPEQAERECTKDKDCNSPRFSVMQFNVLADSLSGADPNRGGFTQTPQDVLNWEQRKWRLAQVLVESLLSPQQRASTTTEPPRSLPTAAPLAAQDPDSEDASAPDLIALQEVDHFGDWFAPLLSSLGYEGLYASKSAPTLNNTFDGCALFWRRAKFRRLHGDRLALCEIVRDGQPDAPPAASSSTTTSADSPACAAASCATPRRTRPCNQVALIADLALLHETAVSGTEATARVLTIAVTHLKSTKSAVGETTRGDQLTFLLNALEQRLHDGSPRVGDQPLERGLIVAGDFNALPESTAHVAYESIAYPVACKHACQLASAYSTYPLPPSTPSDEHQASISTALREAPYTTWKTRGRSTLRHTIDYIFASKGVPHSSMVQLKPVVLRAIPDPQLLPEYGAPCPQWPSDHFALMATFTWRPTTLNADTHAGVSN